MKEIKNINPDRFWPKVKKGDGCWEWIGGMNDNGYGEVYQNNSTYRAHRVAYTLVKGGIPEGLTIDHLCKNTICVNPDHLEAVTLEENIRRSDFSSALNRRKTQCQHGHEFDEKNTYKRPNGGRDCRKCKVIKHMRWVRRSREPGYVSTKSKKHLPEAK